jgi:alkylation response protein AidB-like acyl-CoA dehydrogenase
MKVMVDLALTDEQQAVRKVAAELGTNVVEPASARAAADGAVPAATWKKLLDTGLVAPAPAEFGGGGMLDPLTEVMAVEGLAVGDCAVAAAAAWAGAANVVMDACGSPEQRAEHFPRQDGGIPASSVALYEGYGRPPSEYQTTITREAGGWHVQGRKAAVRFDTQDTKSIVVIGRDQSDSGRLRAVVASASELGVTLAGLPVVGLEAASLMTMRFDAVLDESHLVGGPAAGTTALARATARCRLLVAALAVGTAQRAVRYAASYATTRVIFDKPLSSHQGTAFLLTDAQMRVDAARMSLWKMATVIGEAKLGTPEDERRLEDGVSHAVSYSADVAASATRDAVQVLGGHGYVTDHPVERWFRAAVGLCALDCDLARSTFSPGL